MNSTPFVVSPEAQQVLDHPFTQNALRPTSESAKRAADPNTQPEGLFTEAVYCPLEVLQNPVMPLLALEDPSMWLRVRHQAFLYLFTFENARLIKHPDLFYDAPLVRRRFFMHLHGVCEEANARGKTRVMELWREVRTLVRQPMLEGKQRQEASFALTLLFREFAAEVEPEKLLRAAAYNVVQSTPTSRLDVLENLCARQPGLVEPLYERYWWWAQLVAFWETHRRHTMALDDTKNQITALGCGDAGCVITTPGHEKALTSEGCWCIKAMGADPRKANVTRAFQLYRWVLDEYSAAAAKLDPLITENAKLREQLQVFKDKEAQSAKKARKKR